MNRTEFLVATWQRFFKPALVIALLVLLTRFFFYALDTEINERQIINLMAVGLIAGGLVMSLSLTLAYIGKLVMANAPEAMKVFFARRTRLVSICLFIVLALVFVFYCLHFFRNGEIENLIGFVLICGTVLGLQFRRRRR